MSAMTPGAVAPHGSAATSSREQQGTGRRSKKKNGAPANSAQDDLNGIDPSLRQCVFSKNSTIKHFNNNIQILTVYVATNYTKHQQILIGSIERQVEAGIEEKEEPAPDITGAQLEIRKVKNKKHVDEKETSDNFKIALYAIALEDARKRLKGN
jgi:hypothetical protein